MKIAEGMAKTRKEAIQSALDKLGCGLDEVEIEILDEGSKGFMGIGQRDVHVRLKAPHLEGGLVVDEEDEELAEIDDNIGNRIDGPEPQPKYRPQTRRRGGQRGRGRDRQQPGQSQPHLVRGGGAQQQGGGPRGGGRSDAKRGEGNRGGGRKGGERSGGGRGGRQGGGRDRQGDRGRGEAREDRGSRPRRGGDRPQGQGQAGRGRRRSAAPPQAKPKPRKERTKPIDRDAAETLGKSAAALLEELLGLMDMPGKVTSALDRDDNIVLDVETEHGGILIGRKGKNLESMQFLINRIFVSGDDNDTVDRILIDIEGYRKRRREQLEDMARSMAEKVKETGRSLRVKPLDPQERRIIHLVLQDDEAVRTFSLGNSLHRRVVIAPVEEESEIEDRDVADDDEPEHEDSGFEADEFDEDPDFKPYEEDGESVTAEAAGEGDK